MVGLLLSPLKLMTAIYEALGEDSKDAVPGFVSKPNVKDAPCERGEAALKDEAKSLQRLIFHV